jgi:putative tryptophan/tyrosine transport system substrate-binding protein
MTRGTQLALAALAASLSLASAVEAQQVVTLPHIGLLLVGFSPDSKEALAFQHGLQEGGYIEGRNVVIEWQSANGDYDQLPRLAAALVQRRLDVIVVDSTPGALAVKRATSTIPVVMTLVGDPVGSGLVANLAHPSGNVTGLSAMAPEVGIKRLQLLRDTLTRLRRVAVLWDPALPWHSKVIEELKVAAPSLRLELTLAGVRTPGEIDPAFSAIRRAHAKALYIVPDALFLTHRMTLLKLASKARLPAMFGDKEFVYAGGLMSYGASYEDLFRRAAGYAVKILKGAKPADLPIEQPTKFELVVNLKTAKALGITIPESILLRADEVIR